MTTNKIMALVLRCQDAEKRVAYAALQQRKFLALAPATGTTGAGGDEAAE